MAHAQKTRYFREFLASELSVLAQEGKDDFAVVIADADGVLADFFRYTQGVVHGVFCG